MNAPTPLRPRGNDKLFRAALGRWFARHGRALPWRDTRDPYAILVSEIMLQQTQVATVIGYFQRWMRLFPTFESLAAAPEPAVLHAWQGLGYYSRARNLHRAASAIVTNHGGCMPADPRQIRALPGIGPYTAGAVAAFAFDLPVPAVDGNVARVLARLFDLRAPVDSAHGAKALQDLAAQLQPARKAGRFNAALMELGALVCLPRRPACARCPVRQFCATDSPEALPVKRARPRVIDVEERRGFALSRGRVLLQEETSRRWRGLWTLPPANGEAEELLTLRYPITHHRVTMRVVRAEARTATPPAKWVRLDALESIPMPSPHRRALRLLISQRRLDETAGRGQT